MGVEIERKFLLSGDAWRQAATSRSEIRQGYLAEASLSSVRVRIEDEAANLNIKSAEAGAGRLEYEYPIPLADARELLERLCLPGVISKFRWLVSSGEHVWEIDEFLDDNAGLIVAEIELDHVDEPFERPHWLGEEVTHSRRYYNHALSSHPFSQWTAEEQEGP